MTTQFSSSAVPPAGGTAEKPDSAQKRHLLSALVQNQPGVLAHVSGMFSSRGFNIESLAVGETENPHLSRITVVVMGDDRHLDQVRKQPPVALRDLLDFRTDGLTPISVDEVESVTEIRRRLLAPGISLGALSPEAHETLSIAMRVNDPDPSPVRIHR